MSDTSMPMCFLGMPCGRSTAERLAYGQWRTQVLEPAIDASGYGPWVSESDAAPVDIAADILRNLVEAPMALFDMGGFEPGDAVNANVMYELGIRHAFHKPAIVYSPDGSLPFDVQAGRALLAPRTMEAAAVVQAAIVKAIAEAKEGRFWKPMMAVASLDRLHDALAKSSDLAPVIEHMLAITQDLHALRSEVRERGRYRYAFADRYNEGGQADLFGMPLDVHGTPVDVRGTPVDATGRLRPGRNYNFGMPTADTMAQIEKIRDSALTASVADMLRTNRKTPDDAS